MDHCVIVMESSRNLRWCPNHQCNAWLPKSEVDRINTLKRLWHHGFSQVMQKHTYLASIQHFAFFTNKTQAIKHTNWQSNTQIHAMLESVCSSPGFAQYAAVSMNHFMRLCWHDATTSISPLCPQTNIRTNKNKYTTWQANTPAKKQRSTPCFKDPACLVVCLLVGLFIGLLLNSSFEFIKLQSALWWCSIHAVLIAIVRLLQDTYCNI